MHLTDPRPDTHTSKARPSLTDGRACFVGSTLVDTTQGRLQISELAHLSTRRAQIKAGWQHTIDERLAQLEAHTDAKQQAAAALSTASGVFRSMLLEVHAQLNRATARLTAAVTQAQSNCAAHIDGCLPQVRVRNPDTGSIELRAIEAVVLVDSVTDVVDVDIGATHLLTCTPSQLFDAADGFISAPDLVGHSVHRINADGTAGDLLAITSITERTLGEAVPVFDVIVEGGDTFAVAVNGNTPSVCVRSGGGQ